MLSVCLYLGESRKRQQWLRSRGIIILEDERSGKVPGTCCYAVGRRRIVGDAWATSKTAHGRYHQDIWFLLSAVHFEDEREVRLS